MRWYPDSLSIRPYSWTAEAADVADASPTLGSPSIPVRKGDAFVQFSCEVEGNAVNFLSDFASYL